jgi:hypothetical protein
MNRIRQFGLIILIVIPLAVLVLIRTTTPRHFKHNAQKLAEASFNHTNTITWDQLKAMGSEFLIIDLDDRGSLIKSRPEQTINIPFRSLLQTNGRKMIRTHKGPILLYSEDMAVTAKAWMLLSQMGYRNLFILTGDADNEVMKYEFRPDTIQTGIQ